MITVDGSIGGGQILRTAVALSSLTLKPIKVINIRASRPRPGLMPQHLTGIQVAAEFCGAELRGAQYSSMEVEFIPTKLDVKDKVIDIGTSGSIGLLLQTLTPLIILSDRRVRLEIAGGTAGLGSPTIEYVKYVTFPVLNKLGVHLPEIKILRHGFYPRGGGRVEINFEPSKLFRIQLGDADEVKSIKGISVVGSLSDSIAARQANAAKNILGKFKDVSIETNAIETFSQGTSITLWADCGNSTLGGSALGKRGLRAEDVGSMAANELLKSIESNAAIDKYMADQIIPYLALADGKSIVKVEEITDHCKTNISVCEKILGCKFSVNNKIIEVNGIKF
jgi:RNA 3'-terminal phosphate cyclase (ATP)